MSSETHDAITGPDPSLPPEPAAPGPAAPVPAAPVPAAPATAAPATSVKDAMKAVDSAFKIYSKRVDGARKGLYQAEKQYAAAVKSAERDCEQAGRPAKIASVGLMTRVTLTETTIKTPKGEFPLTPDVTISAEQHGTKQVVQGWVFKSDNDRREVYLHVTGPDWADVVPFALKNSVTDARQLHEFAARAGVAARNSDNARAALAQRAEAAGNRLAAARANREPVHEAAEAYVASAWDVQDLKPTSDQLAALLEHADQSDRKARKATEELQQVRTQVKSRLAEAETERNRVQDATAEITATAEVMATTRIPSPVIVRLISAGNKQIQVIKIIREATRLGLRDAKNLTERTPSVILTAARAEDAERLRASLEAVGATVLVESAPERDHAQAHAHAPAVATLPPAVASSEEPRELTPGSPLATATAADTPAQPDVIDQIKRLGELRDAGLLTDDEFAAKKADLLSRL
jgi:large subunit ribosomal protein L7/L12